MSITGTQLIGAERVVSSSDTFHGVNPANGLPLAPAIFEGTKADVHHAAELARRDFDAFRTTSLEDRARFLETVADEIMALGDALIQRAHAETGLPTGRFQGERGRTVNQLRLFAQVVRRGHWLDARIDTAQPDRAPLPKPDVRSMRVALGPVAVFGASNFPLAFSVAGGDTASALAAGCPVIVKGHPAHPGTSELVGQAIQKAVQKTGMPEGTFSLIQGSGIHVGTHLVQHPSIKAVGFTGSYRGGKALFDLAALRPEPIPVYAEMGSTNPVFVLPGALEARGVEIAQGLAGSVTLGVGQFCTNPGLVLTVEGPAFTAFRDAAAEAVSGKPVGTMLHAGIQSAYEAGIRTLSGVDGVTVAAEAPATETEPGCAGIPRLLTTTSATLFANPFLQEEVFGPSTLLVACATPEEFEAVAASLEGHLTATVFGTETELADYAGLITLLERKVGRLVFNGYPTGVEVCDAMVHGGPFPATTDSRTTSVGTAAIERFLRPVCYQDWPDALLPPALQNANPWQIERLVNAKRSPSTLPE